MPKYTTSARLPNVVRPIHYDLHLIPDLEKLTFSGNVFISIDIFEKTSEIVLHAKELVVKNVAFLKMGKSIFSNNVKIDDENERIILYFPPLPKGKAKLNISFEGKLNDQMAGFYKSDYSVNGTKKVMAVTQFEATDARRAFPCWDEPALKATFRVSFVVPNGLSVLSNMPQINECISGDKKIVYFGTTPAMSTYLLAFVVGELEHIEALTKNSTLVRVFTTPGKKEQGRFALDAGVKILEFYNDYFGISYPLPKLDMVTAPDFAAGAMENWGLITYRETALLIDPENSSSAIKQRVATVVAHEISHQWFGNLVTMEWWTQLWLNEGFATWMEYLAMDSVFPEWNIWDHFVANDYTSALTQDGLRSTHPLEVEINHPSEINQTFDSISYQKGAAIIRMIHDHLGPEKFKEGMRVYLERHKYSNAVTEDLWRALEDVSQKPVKEMMDTWTKQAGYPVLTLKKIKNNIFKFSQSRFLSSGRNLLPSEKEQSWDISIPYLTDKLRQNGKNHIFMDNASTLRKLSMKNNGWVKLNAGQTAFLRINYTEELWENLKDAVSNGSLSSIDRLGIVNDLYTLAGSGEVSATRLLSFLEVYKNEKEYMVWSDIVASLGGLQMIIPKIKRSEGLFNSFAADILTNIAGKVGWDKRPDESHADILLRSMILSAYGDFGDNNTMCEAKKRFKLFLKDPKSLDPDLRSTVYYLVAKNGTTSTFDVLVDCYRRTESQEEKMRILSSLGRFKDIDILKRGFKFAVSEDVRAQDLPYFIGGVGRNGSNLSWKFFMETRPMLYHRYRGSLMLLSHIIESILSGLRSVKNAEEVEEFFKKNPLPEASRAIRRSLENIRARDAWIKRDRKAVVKWLQDRSLG